MNTLLIDNHDSFSYNLLHLLRSADRGSEVDIIRCEDVSEEEVLKARRVVVSPGPGLPFEREGLMHSIEMVVGRRPLLGVCLGHQAIALHFGANLSQLQHPTHGVRSELQRARGPLFDGIATTTVARYHSWVVAEETLPSCLEATSYCNDGSVMSLQHKSLPIYGVQFHPESFATADGLKMICNFYKL